LTRTNEDSPKRTVVIIDGENANISLRKIGLSINNLKEFVYSFLDKNDELTQFKNREGKLINPVVYIENRSMDAVAREKQIEKLNEIKSKNRDFIKLFVADPKVSGPDRVSSCTDSVIAAFIAMALYDKNVDKIIVVSGDGDFFFPLEIIGVVGKEIDMVGIWGAASGKLIDFVHMHNGRVIIIGGKVPGVIEIQGHPLNKKKDRQERKYHSRCLKENWNNKKRF
jgi:uncharacterized LabA/DUF88 family protein